MGIALLIVGFVAGIVFVATRQSAEWRCSRNALINAEPTVVFAHVNALEKWQAWSPWAHMEPEAKITFTGPKAGQNAAMSWAGNKIGAGTLTITESIPAERIVIRLDFTKPMVMTQYAELTFAPEVGKTRMIWSAMAKSPLLNRVFGLIMNCDKMVGDQYEKAFKNLNDVIAKT